MVDGEWGLGIAKQYRIPKRADEEAVYVPRVYLEYAKHVYTAHIQEQGDVAYCIFIFPLGEDGVHSGRATLVMTCK